MAKVYRSKTNRRISNNLRCRVWHALRGNAKAKATLSMLGCTVEFLRGHLEARFKSGMTWDNYGSGWHIDHIIPCAEFDLSKVLQQRQCFHYTNLQPLWGVDNMRKHAKVEGAYKLEIM